MIPKKKSLIAFIPARSGSKTIKNKNLKKIKNQSLVDITVKLALKSNLFAKIILSSDSDKILKIGSKYKKITNIKRPKSISKDSSKTDDALLHYLTNYKPKEKNIVLLQATSPLRKIKTLKNFINFCLKKNIRNCLTVSQKKDHFSRPGKYFKSLEKISRRRRQSREGFLFENGLLYFIDIKKFLSRKKIYSNKWNHYITDEYESIDINNLNDFKIVKKLYTK